MLVSITDPILQKINISNTASPAAGYTDALKATGLFSDGSTTDLTQRVTWASSNTSIFSIDANGLVTGLLQGVANATATYLPPGANVAVVGVFSDTILEQTPVNIVIPYVPAVFQRMFQNATTFVQYL